MNPKNLLIQILFRFFQFLLCVSVLVLFGLQKEQRDAQLITSHCVLGEEIISAMFIKILAHQSFHLQGISYQKYSSNIIKSAFP